VSRAKTGSAASGCCRSLPARSALAPATGPRTVLRPPRRAPASAPPPHPFPYPARRLAAGYARRRSTISAATTVTAKLSAITGRPHCCSHKSTVPSGASGLDVRHPHHPSFIPNAAIQTTRRSAMATSKSDSRRSLAAMGPAEDIFPLTPDANLFSQGFGRTARLLSNTATTGRPENQHPHPNVEPHDVRMAHPKTCGGLAPALNPRGPMNQ